MAEPGTLKTEEVAEAMAICFEREDASGAPWCPPRDADVLRYWITDRSRELGTGLRRVVRFVRLAALADGRDYVRFVYLLPALRPRHFEAAIRAAAAAGRLDAEIAEVRGSEVVLKEKAAAPTSDAAKDGFEISFAQMPRLAALLDILHNALGYGVVADLLQPALVRGPPTTDADKVANVLQAKFGAWLSERLDSPHYLRQTQAIRSFLAGRGRVEPEAIDDEAILAFWTVQATVAKERETEGFRLFNSAARALLRYGAALRDAVAARALEKPLAIGTGPDDADIDLDRLGPREAPALHVWRSPLNALAAPPADTVKWLNKKERLQLINYLGGPLAEDEPAADGDEADGEPAAETGLAGSQRFDLRFLRTLLRADVFGAAQASIVARLRKRVSAPVAIEAACSPLGEAAYEDCAASYGAIRDQLRLECLAALVILLEAGAAESLVLLRHLGGSEVVEEVLALGAGETVLPSGAFSQPAQNDNPSSSWTEDDWLGNIDYESFERRIAPALRRAAAPTESPSKSISDLVEAARLGSRKVSRAGFRREDRSDPKMLAALRKSTPAVTDVLRELDRLLSALSLDGLRERANEDHQHFSATLRQIYSTSAEEH
jgi:hypothetical protein